jgi:hypothetical protein
MMIHKGKERKKQRKQEEKGKEYKDHEQSGNMLSHRAHWAFFINIYEFFKTDHLHK